MIDIDAVTRLIEEAAHDLVVPRFRRLLAADIESKATADDPQDIVTAVDRDVEARLTAEFRAMTPGTVVARDAATSARVRGWFTRA